MNNARVSRRRPAGQLQGEHLLEQHVAERTRELTALLEVSRGITSTLALEPLLDLILDQLLRVIDYRSAGIFLARDDALETVASRDTKDHARRRSYRGHRRPLPQVAAIWQTLLRGEPLLIGDVRRDDHPLASAWHTATSSYRPDLLSPPVRTWMAVPLAVRGQVVGYLALTREVPDSFTARDTELAVAFAGHAAVAIDNARLLDESERRAREQATLLEVSRAVASTLELTPLLDLILEQLLRVIDYRTAGIFLARDDGVEAVAARDTRGQSRGRWSPGHRRPLAQLGAIWQALLRGEPLLIGDLRRDDDPLVSAWRTATSTYRPDLLSPPVLTWMAVPLSVRGQVVGYLALTREVPSSFTPAIPSWRSPSPAMARRRSTMPVCSTSRSGAPASSPHCSTCRTAWRPPRS